MTPCVTATEPCVPMLHKKKTHNEKPVHRNKEYPSLTATTESLRAATKTQSNQNSFFMCMEFINIMNGKYTI